MKTLFNELSDDEDNESVVSEWSETEVDLNSPYIPYSSTLYRIRLQEPVELEPLEGPKEWKYAGETTSKTVIAVSCDNYFESEKKIQSLCNLFPSNIWLEQLEQHERESLEAYLPQLEGWKGKSKEEAMNENLRLLFSNANFHFGNPVAQLSQQMQRQERTLQGIMQKQQRILQEKHEFYLQKQKFMMELLQSIQANRQKFLSAPPSTYYYPNESKTTNTNPAIVHESCKLGKAITQCQSLFLAIRQVLTQQSTAPLQWTAESIFAEIQENHPQVLREQKDIPVYLAQYDMFHAALLFLQNPVLRIIKEEVKVKAPEVQVWEMKRILQPGDDHTLVWNTNHNIPEAEEKLQLMIMERLFFTPPEKELQLPPRLRSLAKAARTSAIEQWKSEVKKQNPETIPVPQEWKLSKGLVHAIDHNLFKSTHLEDFQTQEWQRYQTPEAPFAYVNRCHLKTYVTRVGPLVATTPTREDQEILVEKVPSHASLLNLLRDAIARLPDGYGTRCDIKLMLCHSQFIRLSVEESRLDGIIINHLERLAREPDPCVLFNGLKGVWEFRRPKHWESSSE